MATLPYEAITPASGKLSESAHQISSASSRPVSQSTIKGFRGISPQRIGLLSQNLNPYPVEGHFDSQVF